MTLKNKFLSLLLSGFVSATAMAADEAIKLPEAVAVKEMKATSGAITGNTPAINPVERERLIKKYELEDFFAKQDEVAKNVFFIRALKLSKKEWKRIYGKAPSAKLDSLYSELKVEQK